MVMTAAERSAERARHHRRSWWSEYGASGRRV